MVQDGLVFTLPTEGRNLLVYDAGSGVEVKRIDLKHMEQVIAEETKVSSPFDTLLGIDGDKMVLASENTVIGINWKSYTNESFSQKNIMPSCGCRKSSPTPFEGGPS